MWHWNIFSKLNSFILNVTLVSHLIGATLLDGLFIFSHKITFRPFQTGLQKKMLKKCIPSSRVKYRVKINSSTKIYATLYFSTMDFHKSATVLNEMTNMLLALTPYNFEISITTFNSPIVSNGTVSGRESV